MIKADAIIYVQENWNIGFTIQSLSENTASDILFLSLVFINLTWNLCSRLISIKIARYQVLQRSMLASRSKELVRSDMQLSAERNSVTVQFNNNNQLFFFLTLSAR